MRNSDLGFGGPPFGGSLGPGCGVGVPSRSERLPRASPCSVPARAVLASGTAGSRRSTPTPGSSLSSSGLSFLRGGSALWPAQCSGRPWQLTYVPKVQVQQQERLVLSRMYRNVQDGPRAGWRESRAAHPGPVAAAKERLCLGSVTGGSGVQGMVCLGRCGCRGQQRGASVCGRPAAGRPSRGHCGARAEQSPGRHGRAGAASRPRRLWLAPEGRAALRPATSLGRHQRRGWFQKNTFVILGALPNGGQ